MQYPTLVQYHLNFGITGNKAIRNSTMFNMLDEESLALLSNGQKHQYRYKRSRNGLVLVRYDKKFLKKNNFDKEKYDLKAILMSVMVSIVSVVQAGISKPNIFNTKKN